MRCPKCNKNITLDLLLARSNQSECKSCGAKLYRSGNVMYQLFSSSICLLLIFVIIALDAGKLISLVLAALVVVACYFVGGFMFLTVKVQED